MIWNGKVMASGVQGATPDDSWEPPGAVPVDEWEPAGAVAPEPSAARAGVLGVAQGGTFGFADEIGGALGSLFVPKSGVKLGPAATQEMREFEANRPSGYELVRDGMRREAEAAEKAHPGVYTAAELASGLAVPLPGGALKGAAKVGRAAAVGAANALGHAEGSAGSQALQTLAGAGTGVVLDKIGSKLKGGKLAQWFGRLGGNAEAEMLEQQAAAKAKDIAQKSGALGSEAAEIMRGMEVAEKGAQKLAESNPALAEELRAAASDPAALERLAAASKNYAGRIKEGLSGFAAKEAELAAAKARDPAAEAAGRSLKDVLLDRKMKQYVLDRALPVAGAYLGSELGGEDHRGTGALIGGTAATLLGGKPGTKLMNLLRSPEARKAIGGAGQKALQTLGSGAEKLARPGTLAITDELAEWLRKNRRE